MRTLFEGNRAYYIERKEAIYCLSAVLSSSVGSQNQRSIDCGRLQILASILAES